MLRAPRVPETSGFRHLAVIPFEHAGGPAGGAAGFTAALEDTLRGIRFGPHPYFTLVERSQIDAALAAQGLPPAGLIDADVAPSLGAALDVEALYTGRVRVDLERRDFTEDRQRCAEQARCQGLTDCLLRSCTRLETVQVTCRTVTATATAAPRLIDSATGTQIYGRRLSEGVTASGCPDRAPPDEDTLIARARNAVLGQLAKDVAPWHACRPLDLEESPDFTGADQTRFAEALALARDGRIERACRLFDALAADHPADPALTANRGLCRLLEAEMAPPQDPPPGPGAERARRRQASAPNEPQP